MCIIDANATEVNKENTNSTVNRRLAKLALSRITQSAIGAAVCVAGTLAIVGVIKNAQEHNAAIEENNFDNQGGAL